jgi:hypothetical protein
VVVVVADPILEARWRASGLNAPDETFVDEEGERVVHRLERDGADLGPGHLGRTLGRDVRVRRDRSQDRQSLGRHLDAALAKEGCRVGGHAGRLNQLFD